VGSVEFPEVEWASSMVGAPTRRHAMLEEI
jgi:hypothetical protein